MSMKLIAIGNKLMGDDGVALLIAEKLRSYLEENCIEVIIGETDFEYCMDKIEEGDLILILDATKFGIESGEVTFHHLKEICLPSLSSQHGYSLLRALRGNFETDSCMLIGIEGSNFNFSIGISLEIEKKIENICLNIKKIINILKVADIQNNVVDNQFLSHKN